MSEQKLNNVTLFTFKYSPSCRLVRLVLKELNLSCEIKEVDFGGGEHKSKEYLKINPVGKVPALKDGDLCFGESRAISCYLCNKYAPNSQLYPKDPDARARVDYVLFADMDFVQTMGNYVKPAKVFFTNEKPDLTDDSQVQKAFEIYEELLSRHKFLAADFMTLADLCAINAIGVLDVCHYSNYAGFPRLKGWIDTMKGLPYYEECADVFVRKTAKAYQQKLEEA